MSIKKNPNRAKAEAAIRELGHAPTWPECKAIGKQWRATPSAVRNWGKKIYPSASLSKALSKADSGELSKAASSSTSTSSREQLSKADSPASASPVDIAFEIEDTPVRAEDAPPAEASAPLPSSSTSSPASTTSSTSSPQVIAPFPTEAVLMPLLTIANGRFEEGGVEPISDMEATALVAAWDPVCQVYLAPLLSTHGPLIGAGVVTIAVFGPRLMQAAENKKRRLETNPAPHDLGDAAAASTTSSTPPPPPAPASSSAPSTLPSQYPPAPDNAIRAAFGGRA